MLNLNIHPKHVRVLSLLLALAGPSWLSPWTRGAEPAEEPAQSVEAMVAEAVAANPEIRFYEEEMAAARAGRRTAGLLANPELNGAVGYQRVQGVDDGLAFEVTLLQPLEWPGRIGLRKSIANQDVALAELGLAGFRQALAGRLRGLAYGLQVAREKAQASREVADRLQALREVLVQRDPAGVTPLLEIRVIEATELIARKHAADAQIAADAALLALNRQRGKPPGTPVRLLDGEPVLRALEDGAVCVAEALTNNFELRLRTAELSQQGLRVDLALNERYPAVRVGPTYLEERAGDRQRIVGLAFSMPLPLWNRNGGGVEAARSRERQGQAALAAAQLEVERAVHQEVLTYQAKVRELGQWRPDAVAQFREAAETADRHYRLGAVPVATYVELQRQYVEAAEAILDTKLEALEAAARLENLTGRDQGLVGWETEDIRP